MQSIIQYIIRPRTTLFYVFMTIAHFLPERLHLQIEYRMKMGKRLNLDKPQTFCEKLQWLKLYYRKPEYTSMVDKLAIKRIVAEKIGDEYVIPVLGVWDKPEEIDFDSLPNRFVLKTSHGGGSNGVLICKDKKSLNRGMVIKRMQKAMKQNIYKVNLEWPYKNVPRKIFAEQYVEDSSEETDLPDYKWYCFNGEPKFCQVIKNRRVHETIDFFDTEWKHQEFIGLNPNVEHADVIPPRPLHLERQINLARVLSTNIPFARVDLYEINGKIYFGEITFYPASGMGRFRPERYDLILGKMLTIPGGTSGT